MTDLRHIMNRLAGSGALAGFAGGLAGGTVAGALATRKGRKLGSAALKIGGLAAVSGLAWKAYRSYVDDSTNRAEGRPIPPESRGLSRSQFETVTDSASDGSVAVVLMRAMIAAAHADGHMDSGEQQRIFSEVDRLDLSLEEKAMLIDELRHPVSVNVLAEQVPDLAAAIEVYAASLLVIDEEDPAARRHLRILADRLDLPGDLVTSLHAESRGDLPDFPDPAIAQRRSA